ncbi:hypothetical protein [Streptomyces sp. NPDC048172]|uniref:hypothetical protein n=1 Tax=Streptomyces sp. NPDC048172 TaxID=3365505 RepID=UPI00371DA3F4
MDDSTTSETGPRPEAERWGNDCAGAVYGSLLAASVVASAETAGELPRLRLIVLLLVTGLVFWIAHVYTRLAGERPAGRGWSRHETRLVAVREWPVVEAAVLPSVAVALSPLLGMSARGGAWLALVTAVGQQIVWASVSAARVGASRPRIAVEGTVHLCLGLVIVAVKVALKH